MNSERTTVRVARVGKDQEALPASEAARVAAWESDLQSVTCAAIRKELPPRAR